MAVFVLYTVKKLPALTRSLNFTFRQANMRR